MSVHAPLTVPRRPHVEALFAARPARARDAQSLVDALSHLEAWRFRRATTAFVEVDATACPAYITSAAAQPSPRLPPGPNGVTETVRVPHHLCTEAAHLAVSVGYQADGESTTAPRIDIQLYTLGGVLLDRGVRYDHTIGNLPTDRRWDRPLLDATAGVQTFVYPVLWITTPPVAEDDRRTEATPTDPRLLSLADATPRTRVEVRVTSTFARIVAVRVAEHPVEDLG